MKIHIAIAGLPEVLVFSVVPGIDRNELAAACGAAIDGDFTALRAMGNTPVGATVIHWPSVRAVWFTDDTAEAAPDAEEWTTITEDESTWPPERVRVHLFDGKTGYEYSPSIWRPRNPQDLQTLLGDRWRLAREGE